MLKTTISTSDSKHSYLEFTDLVVAVNSKEILKNVSGIVYSGDLLAVMGPTGSGKTTLLNTLAGRIPAVSGRVNLNGMPFDKVLRRRLGYVIQSDVFLPSLTLWETLYFTAMIRISDRFTKAEKLERMNTIVKALGLQKCLHTGIGDLSISGMSGGEKKRASIACELLTDPDILLLDEPTSGLDSSTAYTLMVQLKNYATEFNKTIVATIHQPSSQVFHMFSTLLLLVEGEMAYFGHASSAIGYCSGLGISCGEHYNPADFLCKLLEQLASDSKTIDILKENGKTIKIYPPVRGKGQGRRRYSYTGDENELKPLHVDNDWNKSILHGTCSQLSMCSGGAFVMEEGKAVPRWPTSMLHQLKMLNWRILKQSKGQIFKKYYIIHAVFLALVVGAVYFQIDNVERTVRDKMGLVFFSLLHWGLRIRFATIWNLHKETDVIRKERSVGVYRLSAYYLSKMTTELPLLLVIPTLFNTAVYWAAGLGGVEVYFAYCGFGILNCLLIQSLAHVIGVCINDLTLSMLVMDCFNIGGLLLGGFFNIHPPSWLVWSKYISLVHYPYAATMIYMLKDMENIRCNETSVTSYPQCILNKTEMVTTQDVLAGVGIDLHLHCYVLTLILSIIGFRILGYFALKWKGM
ncbi:uncharacterized protein LOC132563754 [Ylistrum balloti]|uniref:uncharacterized protein LOC132563754 n=1 Tax=Ylistrum balloti TaxID=509963 RepID=UPI002905E1CD|nr:uncharacterized protein LOC132563754 [Ylistrum balloti]